VTHKAGGSGLGLAICRKIVSEHDGRISLHNHPEGGAMITILLPVSS
jgi:nitrogen fixation/metabolism regulation signal transduction histidine kinase